MGNYLGLNFQESISLELYPEIPFLNVMMSLLKNGTKQKQMRALEQLMEKRLFKPRLPGYNSTNSALYCYTLVQKRVGTIFS